MTLDSFSYGPITDEYKKYFSFLSKIIENFTNIIKNFYQDNNIVYLITSDHGVGNRAEHVENNLV